MKKRGLSGSEKKREWKMSQLLTIFSREANK
jgi:hypothetical protein